MNTKLFLFVALFCAGVGSGFAVSRGPTCGQSKPDHHKTCISIRLPWKPEPIYFCTDKENLKYERECTDSEMHQQCPQTTVDDKSLLIATPWECCHIQSRPSNCEHAACAARPFNRTCVTLKQHGACCPTYFCDQTDEGEPTCSFKTLEPSCHTPPTTKTNCVGFIDNHGCGCTKYQCEGEGKAGTCPVHTYYADARRKNVAGNHHTNATARYRASRDRYPKQAKTGSVSPPIRNSFVPETAEISCIGDWNCPGDMKCCSEMYYHYDQHQRYSPASTGRSTDGAAERKMDTTKLAYNTNSNAQFGFCTHPQKNEKSTPKKSTLPPDAEPEETENYR